MKKILSIAIVAIVAFTGCKKSSNDSNSCALSASSIVGTYKITSVVLSTQGQTLEIFNNDAFYDPCQRDNIYTINGNGTFSVTEGATSCNPPGDETGTWTLDGSTFTYAGQVTTVSEFTCSSFKLTSTPMAGESYIITMTRQ